MSTVRVSPISPLIGRNQARSAAFRADRLTPTVFRIQEYDDIYEERPFMYAKILPKFILLLDTGCGGVTKKKDTDVTSLREFIEVWPVSDNNDLPLNPRGAKKYLVVFSHCHYDHILGVEDFATDSQIFRSSHDNVFTQPENLARTSLCEMLGIRTPSFCWSDIDDMTFISYEGQKTGILVLHTPGHTPDELALWDEEEYMLYVGDTVYERTAIIFPNEGDVVHWFSSIDKMITLVEKANSECEHLDPPKRVMLNAGHDTAMGDALDILNEVRTFMISVLMGKEERKWQGKIHGIVNVYYQSADKRFSLRCPLDLLKNAQDRLAPAQVRPIA